MLKTSLLSILIGLCATSFAQEPSVSALTFQSWKEQQTLEAQNQALRISARISQLKSTKATVTENKETKLPNGKVRKSEDSVAAAERDLRRAQDSLQASSGLTLEDYTTIYLPTLHNEPEALGALALKLSKEELAEIFKLLVGRQPFLTDAKRNTALMSDSMTPTSRPKVP